MDHHPIKSSFCIRPKGSLQKAVRQTDSHKEQKQEIENFVGLMDYRKPMYYK
jgi:hypothetical protein